jgi:rSAM/selenodomain-associated transferase 2
MRAETAEKWISLVVPILNESRLIRPFLRHLQPFREQGAEIVLCDGGSTDGTRKLAEPEVDAIVSSPRGRAVQMNSGARVARGEVLLFLHADTLLPREALREVRQSIRAGCGWGRFDVRLSGIGARFRLIEALMNWRSRLTGIATGDQALYVTRSLFRAVGGFSEIPLMEDIEMSRRLKCHSAPACLSSRVLTSSRRWEQGGVFRTVLLMWSLRAAYALGVDPVRLARWYR